MTNLSMNKYVGGMQVNGRGKKKEKKNKKNNGTAQRPLTSHFFWASPFFLSKSWGALASWCLEAP